MTQQPRMSNPRPRRDPGAHDRTLAAATLPGTTGAPAQPGEGESENAALREAWRRAGLSSNGTPLVYRHKGEPVLDGRRKRNGVVEYRYRHADGRRTWVPSL